MNFTEALPLLLILLLLTSAWVCLVPRTTNTNTADQMTTSDVTPGNRIDEIDETNGIDETDEVDETDKIDETDKTDEVVMDQASTLQVSQADPLSRNSDRDIERNPAPAIIAEFTVTAYTANDPGMDGRGITATGTKVTFGRTIAVDPKLIPYGSRVYIPALKDWPNGGWFIAEDTGGAIKGYKLDIFIPDRDAALRFGRQKLIAHVYKPKEDEE